MKSGGGGVKIVVPLNEFNRKMSSISSVVPSKTTMPVLSTVLVSAEEEGITLSATDLDISVTAKLEGEVEEKGSISAPARKLAEISKSLSGEGVTLDTENERVKVSCGRSRFSVIGRPAEDFPKVPKQDVKSEFEVDRKLLSDMISKTSYAVSTDLTRPALCGVLWEVSKQGLAMVATDGHRLAKVEVNLDIEVTQKAEVIVPIKTLNALRVFSEGDEKVRVGIGENSIRFELKGALIYSRLLEGPFPNYQRVIPTGNDKELVVSRDLLAEATKRVSILSDAMTHQVIFSIGENKLTLNVTTKDVGEAIEELEASYSSEPMEIGYNANYIMDVLKTIDSDDVRFLLDRPDNAALIKPGEESQGMKHMCIIMPLRLS